MRSVGPRRRGQTGAGRHAQNSTRNRATDTVWLCVFQLPLHPIGDFRQRSTPSRENTATPLAILNEPRSVGSRAVCTVHKIGQAIHYVRIYAAKTRGDASFLGALFSVLDRVFYSRQFCYWGCDFERENRHFIHIFPFSFKPYKSKSSSDLAT